MLLVAQNYLGGWPDLWRSRRRALPYVARFGAGEYPAVDDLVDVDLEETLPEKTALPLEERVGVIDAPPSQVRKDFCAMPRVYPNNLASIQYDIGDGHRVWEVGLYALCPGSFLGVWQYHVRLTPVDGGQKTALWSYFERSAWRRSVLHYRAVGWDADRGVREVVSWFASDERFEASARAVQVLGRSSTASSLTVSGVGKK